jgi:hypothetical protein
MLQVQAELDDHLGKRKTVSLGKLFFLDPERLIKNVKVFVSILFFTKYLSVKLTHMMFLKLNPPVLREFG